MNFKAHPLEFAEATWRGLILDLRKRGEGQRESGAFILGRQQSHAAQVVEWLPYDVLDPASLDFDYIRLGTDAFPRLWGTCEEQRLTVVADVHTHPYGPGQSYSDRAHPMVSLHGHVALIVPNYALMDVVPIDISVNVYLGSGKWNSYFGERAAQWIRLTT